jgi:hypothetical protein
MKNKLFLTFAVILFATITVFNINLAQQGTAADITLVGIELEAVANEGIVDHIEDPHTATYACRDTDNWRDKSAFPYNIRDRVCSAPSCARKYVRNSAFPNMASCTVYYNFP